MYISNTSFAGIQPVLVGDIGAPISNFVTSDYSPIWSFIDSLRSTDWLTACQELWVKICDWLSQPYVMAVVIAWVVTFTVICVIILGLGFGPVGIGAGTLAAAFQSYMYGGFTPAGGIFATLTSMAMLGALMPAAVIVASFFATMVAAIVWGYGVGR